MSDALLQWSAVAGLVALTALWTALLRWARPGARSRGNGWVILGGMFAGVLMGPTILGRVLPVQYERWFVGGVEERQARDQMIRRHGADQLAADHAAMRIGGIDRDQIAARHAAQQRELDGAIQDWRNAQWQDQHPLRITTLVVAALVLFLGAGRSVGRGDSRQRMLSALSIGTWAAVLPGALVYVAMTAWWGFAPLQGLTVAAACAIGPWMLTAIDRRAADQAEFGGARMIQTAGRIASLLAAAAAMFALWIQHGADGFLYALPLLAMMLGWVARGWRAEFGDIIQKLLVASLAALVALKIELFEHFSIWPMLVILVLSDDGRWFGAFLGAMLLGGRRALRTTRLVIGSMSAGPTQLAVTAMAAHLWAIPELLLLPLLLGCLLIEFTLQARRRFTQRLAEMEIELGAYERE